MPTLPERRFRAIAGLSMGGHGALYLALTHPATFGAASSLSGGVDLTVFPERWSKVRHLGPYAQDSTAWQVRSVLHLVRQRRAPGAATSGQDVDLSAWPALLVDCGTSDFFLDANRRLHAELTSRNLPHDYVERPGGHAWAYWTRALPFHLAFFREAFDRA